MEEKSAFDMLIEMYHNQKAFNIRMENLEKALLLLLNEIRGNEDPRAASQDPEVFTMQASEESKPEPKVKKIKPAPNIRVTGNIKDDMQKGISGVKITIYDSKNNIIKETKTNKAGSFFSFLPPGIFVAHYSNENPKIDKNVNFEIKMGDKEVKV